MAGVTFNLIRAERHRVILSASYRLSTGGPGNIMHADKNRGCLAAMGLPCHRSQATGVTIRAGTGKIADGELPDSASRSRASPSPPPPFSRRTLSSPRSCTTRGRVDKSFNEGVPIWALKSSRRIRTRITAISNTQNDAQREQALRRFAVPRDTARSWALSGSARKPL